MQPYELDAWLGPLTTTDEQRDAILQADNAIQARYPDRDAADDRTAALTAAVTVIVGDDTLRQIGDQWKAARRVEREAMAALTGAIIASSTTMTEVAMSAESGVNRTTVRKALGK